MQEMGIEQLYAHPHYPQDKGKVERSIRTIAEEFIRLLRKFPDWLEHLAEWVLWYNHRRMHRGIHDIPARVYGV